MRAAHAVAPLERHASGLKHRCCEEPAKSTLQVQIGSWSGLIRSRDPDGYPRPKHNRSPSGGAPCNPMQKNREVPLRKSLFRHSLPNRAPSTDFSLSATPFHFFSRRRAIFLVASASVCPVPCVRLGAFFASRQRESAERATPSPRCVRRSQSRLLTAHLAAKPP